MINRIIYIFIFSLVFSISRDDIYDNSWAVIIGINEYEHVDKLNYAVQDAEALKKLLVSSFNFPEKQIQSFLFLVLINLM